MSKSQERLVNELMAATRDNDVAQVKALLSQIRDGINATDNDGNTALHIAAAEGSEEVVSCLLSKGADVESTNDEGETARDLADNNGHDDIVTLLDDHEQAEDDTGEQEPIDDLIAAAGDDNDLDTVKKILPKISSVNAVNDDGDTALYIAAQNGNLEIVKYLLSQGADVDAGNSSNWTALHIAAQEGHMSIVKCLLQAGADISLSNDNSDTALDKARNNDHEDIVELLENAQRLRDIVEWSLLGSAKLVHIEASLVLDRKLVEIFNFDSRKMLTYTEKLKPGSEPPVPMPTESFDDLPEETLRNAFRQFTQLGGKADECFVLHAKVRLKKSPLKPKQGE
ncbi:MAG: ankyrin repeat domain-containing protein [Alphaproteobacteria bacterium]|nr:ankyrin repeat domain-containing protein [Alphaproteobacteria bacterium]